MNKKQLINLIREELIKCRVDQTLKDTEPIKEIKVNKPTKTWDDVLELVGKIHQELGVNPRFKETKRIAKQLGWKENGQDITTYINNNPKLISKFYNELLKLKKPIQEIKINKPLSQFPIKINSMEEWEKIKPQMSKLGYGFHEKPFHSGFPSYLFQSNTYQLQYTANYRYLENYIKKYPELNQFYNPK